jgi:uncharacterized protein
MSIDNPIPAFHVLAKPSGPDCNLDCDYCFYLEKEQFYPSPEPRRMSLDVLESFIRQKIEGHQLDLVHFTWQGGEPTLLGLDFFKHVVRLQKKFAGDKQIENGFQTNGLLLTDEWGQFFKQNQFLVGLSIDGPEAIHDRYRIDKGGNGTHERVMKALQLLQTHGVQFNTLTVVNARNQDHADEVYDFLKSTGSAHWQFIPIVERIREQDGKLAAPNEQEGCTLAKYSVDPKAYGRFLVGIFQRWVKEDVGKIFIQHFEAALAGQLGMTPGVCIWNEYCGQALAIEHNGDVYPCDHYVFPEYKLGNIMETPLENMVNSVEQDLFGNAKLWGLTRDCRLCEVKYLCHGECPKHRFSKSSTGEENHNYLCEGYKDFFTTIHPLLVEMADLYDNGIPIQDVMKGMPGKWDEMMGDTSKN